MPCFSIPPKRIIHQPESDRHRGADLSVIYDFIKKHRRYFIQILFGLSVACLMQLLMPFLTQAIVDAGIKNSSLRLIWLILLGELTIIVGRTATEFVRGWLLLHLSMRINLSLLNSFFIKLMRLPMSFFEIRKKRRYTAAPGRPGPDTQLPHNPIPGRDIHPDKYIGIRHSIVNIQ